MFAEAAFDALRDAVLDLRQQLERVHVHVRVFVEHDGRGQDARGVEEMLDLAHDVEELGPDLFFQEGGHGAARAVLGAEDAVVLQDEARECLDEAFESADGRGILEVLGQDEVEGAVAEVARDGAAWIFVAVEEGVESVDDVDDAFPWDAEILQQDRGALRPVLCHGGQEAVVDAPLGGPGVVGLDGVVLGQLVEGFLRQHQAFGQLFGCLRMEFEQQRSVAVDLEFVECLMRAGEIADQADGVFIEEFDDVEAVLEQVGGGLHCVGEAGEHRELEVLVGLEADGSKRCLGDEPEGAFAADHELTDHVRRSCEVGERS